MRRHAHDAAQPAKGWERTADCSSKPCETERMMGYDVLEVAEIEAEWVDA